MTVIRNYRKCFKSQSCSVWLWLEESLAAQVTLMNAFKYEVKCKKKRAELRLTCGISRMSPPQVLSITRHLGRLFVGHVLSVYSPRVSLLSQLCVEVLSLIVLHGGLTPSLKTLIYIGYYSYVGLTNQRQSRAGLICDSSRSSATCCVLLLWPAWRTPVPSDAPSSVR